jgi:hypothetical protein
VSRGEAKDHVSPAPDRDNEITTCSIGHMNSLLHTQIQSYIGKGDAIQPDYDKLNVDEQIAKIEPQLWTAIRCTKTPT